MTFEFPLQEYKTHKCILLQRYHLNRGYNQTVNTDTVECNKCKNETFERQVNTVE